MANGYQGMTDAAFLAIVVNFSEMITATPTDFGLVASEASAFALIKTAFADAYQVAVNPQTRTKVTIEQRNAARDACETSLRFLVDRVNGTPSVTDAQKISLGIPIRKIPSSIQPPTETPVMVVDSVTGRLVWLKIFQSDGETRSMPKGVRSVMVYSYIGTEPVPDDITKWQVQGLSTRTKCSLDFPVTVPAGSKVWLTAAWLSPRNAAGPACTPISLYLAGGPSVNQAA